MADIRPPMTDGGIAGDPRRGLTFKKLRELGWADLIPICPAGKDVHMVGTPKSGPYTKPGGKIPAVYDPQAKLWRGRGLLSFQMNEISARVWDGWEASIGCRTGHTIGLDCDVTDEAVADEFYRAIQALSDKLIPTHRRFGRKPKWLWVLRCDEMQPTWRIRFGKPGGDVWGFEILGAGRQFVMAGRHPSGSCYQWEETPGAWGEWVQRCQPAFLDRVKQAIQQTITKLGLEVVTAGTGSRVHTGAPPEQRSLNGPREDVLSALDAIRNDLDYDNWINLGTALRAASHGAGWETEALDAWIAFCERYVGELDPAEAPDRKWDSFKPPFRIGAEHVYALAAKYRWNRGGHDAGFLALPEVRAKAATAASDALLAGLEATVEVARPAAVSPDMDPLVRAQQATERLGLFGDHPLAARMVAHYHDRLAFVPERGTWATWNGTAWEFGTSQVHVTELAHRFASDELARFAAREGADPKAIDAAKKIVSGFRKSVDVQAAARGKACVRLQDFDADPWLLNTQSGVVDLRTGQLRSHDWQLRMAKVTGVKLGASGTAPLRWLSFLHEVTEGDPELMGYLQRAVGYTLAGVLTEHKLHFLHGPGGNGKSVFLNVLGRVLGSYAVTADRRVFMLTKFQEHSTTVASLAGARMVAVPEIDEADRWNEPVLKSFAAGDALRARFMRQDEFEFRPQGTLWFAGNEYPRLAKVSPAMERRFRLVEFLYRPAAPDTGLENRLVEQEGPAILRWAVDGCVMWQARGLGTCAAVERGTDKYFASFDPVRGWMNERTVRDGFARESTADLYRSFEMWQKENVERMGVKMSHREFTTRLVAMPGLTYHRTAGERYIKGIRLKLKVVGGTDDASDDT